MAGNENLINGINVVLQIEEAFDKVDQTVKRLKTTLTGLERSLRLPSEVVNQANQLAENLRQNAEAQQNLNNVNNQAQAIRQRARQSTAEEIANNRILARNANNAALSNSALAGAYGRLAAQRAIAERRLQDLIARERTAEQTQRQYNAELRRAQNEFNTLDARVRNADAAVGRFNRNVGNYPANAVRNIQNLVAAFGVVGGITLFAQVSKDIFNTTKQLQSLELAQKNVTGGGLQLADTQQFLSRISEAYGIEINILTQSYTSFLAASRNAIESGKLTAVQIQEIFESVSKASGALGLSAEQQQGALLAIQQMISKGNVQAEEIRGQLAERLPGAFGILAKSMNVTEQELNKLLKDGQVLAADVLPAFARELEKAYGIENLNRVENLAASTTRLGNAWTELVRTIGSSESVFDKTFTKITNFLSGALEGFRRLIRSDEERRKESLAGIEESAYKTELDYLRQLTETNKELVKVRINDNLNDSGPNRLKELRAERQELFQTISTLEEKIRVEKESWSISPNAVLTLKRSLKEANSALKDNERVQRTVLGQMRAASEFTRKEDAKTGSTGKTKKQKADIDYLKEVYQLRKQNADNTIADEQRIMNDEEVNYSKRLDAANNYYFQKKHLIELETQEQLRLNELERKNQTETYSKAITEGQATYSNLQEIEYKYIINKKRIEEKAEYDRNQLIIEERKKLRDVLAGIELQANNNQLDTEALEQYYALQQELSATNVNTSYEQFRDLEKRKQDLETNTAKKRNILQVEETERQIAQLKASQKISDTEEDRNNQNQKLNELNGKLVGLKRQQAELDDKAIEDAKQLSLELKRTTDQYLQGFSNGFLQDAGLDIFTDIFQKGEDGLTNFQRRMKGAGEGLTKQFQVSFTTITELAQQAFAFINQASQTRFRLEYEGLERQKDSQLRFAGESQAAQEEITRQYEEKRRDIRNRELRAQKDQATFNAIINTAQAVVAALPNIPLSVTIGAIGAAQIAFIRAQQIPAFAEGGITEKNGQILVNDAGGSNYREVVMTPSGKVFMPQKRNTIMNMPKGTEIFKDYSTFDKRLNEMLTANNIAPGYNYSLPVLPQLQQSGSGNVTAAIKNGFAGLKQSIVNVSMDKRGWNMSIENGHNEQELRNNSLRCNGRRIG